MKILKEKKKMFVIGYEREELNNLNWKILNNIKKNQTIDIDIMCFLLCVLEIDFLNEK